MNYMDFALRLGLAFLLGVLIGVERQWRQKLAGLRTNCLVSVGSALFVMLAVMISGDSSPSRIAAQVVSGIGFLGAGVIIRDGVNVRGLNTAATLWCSAAVGTLCGQGLQFQAALGAFAVVLANLVLRPLARRIEKTSPASEEEVAYSFTCVCRTQDEAHVRALLLQAIQLLPQRSRRARRLPARFRFGVGDGIRTHDIRNHNPALYQLSYTHRGSLSVYHTAHEPLHRVACRSRAACPSGFGTAGASPQDSYGAAGVGVA